MKPAECFGPLIHEHSLIADGPTVVISHCVLVNGFQRFSILLIHNQLDARSAAWLIFQIAFLLSLPVVPTAVMSLCTDWAQNPLTPTSTGNSQVRQPCFLQSSMSSVYFAPLISLLTPCFPWHCQLNGNELLPSPWPKYLPAEKHSYNI